MITQSTSFYEIHENAIERLSRIIFATRNLCGDEQSAIDDFFAEEKATGPVRFLSIEQAVIIIEATLRAYEMERESEGRAEDE